MKLRSVIQRGKSEHSVIFILNVLISFFFGGGGALVPLFWISGDVCPPKT